MEFGLFVLLIALIADWFFGEPAVLWSRLPHPVVLFGKAISFVDSKFNLESDEDAMRYRKGALAICVLIFLALVAGNLLNFIFSFLGWFAFLPETFIVFVLLAHNSLITHVSAVSKALRNEGLDGGRKAVSMIVGRDPSALDRSAVSRASIESLAENFSDGVIAPAFWYAVFGLPGIIAYKMINTADSMIGYHSTRHEYFGKVAAQIDDIANWLPARLSAILIGVGAFLRLGSASGKNSLKTAFRDAGLHRSPNAGWPEAAMAGAANIALGGPRIYPTETVQQAHLNAGGKQKLDTPDIDKAVEIINIAFLVFCVLVLLVLVI